MLGATSMGCFLDQNIHRVFRVPEAIDDPILAAAATGGGTWFLYHNILRCFDLCLGRYCGSKKETPT